MKASPFFALKNIQGNVKDFHRNRHDGINFGNYCKRGVYFWGFYLGNDYQQIPEEPKDIVIYYIGKEQQNISQRIMQEFTQLIIGGFGTIIHQDWLKDHPFDANLYNKQESDKKGKLHKHVIYKSYGLHVLHDFYYNHEIRNTINWMFERLIFTWVVDDENTKYLIDTFHNNLSDEIKSQVKEKVKDKNKYRNKIENKYLESVEKEFHNIVGGNILGLGNTSPNSIKCVNKKLETPHFNSIDWSDNKILKEWLIKVNERRCHGI